MSESREVDDTQTRHAKDVDGIPYCVLHHCRMKQYSGGTKKAAYYRCPVADCEQTGKTIKTRFESVIPPQPLACPRCSDRKPVFCERDEKNSNAAMTILVCPACNWRSSAMVRPELAAAEFGRKNRAPVEEIGSR